jgi:hypothetical protein
MQPLMISHKPVASMRRAPLTFCPVSISGCDIAATLMRRDAPNPIRGSHQAGPKAHQRYVDADERNGNRHKAEGLGVIADRGCRLDLELCLAQREK